MKTLPSGMQDYLDSGATTMVYCWKVTKKDGTVQGFTECDIDIVFDGLTYLASSGFTATTMTSDLDLSVDNLNVEGVLSSESINEGDLSAGMYDNAEVELFWVNALDTSMRVQIMKGNIGEVKRQESSFSAELRSLSHNLQQASGRTYKRYCDATLGDSRCGVDMTDTRLFSSGSISAVESNSSFTISVAANNVDDNFSLGTLEFTSGLNSGLIFGVKLHSVFVETKIDLWQKTPYDVAVSDTFIIRVGCRKDFGTCRFKFLNHVRFRGFHLIPGVDTINKYATKNSTNQNGGSLFSYTFDPSSYSGGLS